ncbi:response regulator [Sulfurimonas sp.]|jgi:CheY-like chemotaxis protein|uniref:response regulator n=1 Tax=Sulfurimonas sp. TaxID=2022749 RepID=UPI0025EC5DA4|nr:response regulator [Sulfurimonas sp.]MBT5935607.1 response regulator [Sulfurimonas sp.]
MRQFLMILLISTALLAETLADPAFMNGSERLLWMLLVCASIIALLVSSFQIIKLKKEHKELLQKQNAIQSSQDKIISDMSENIYSIVQEAVDNKSLLSQKIEDNPQDKELLEVMNSEKKVLDMTSNLIEFLRIKSKKVEISKENFKFVNLLNDVSGLLISDFQNSNIELTFDVDSDIPYILIGDTLNLTTILKSLLEFCMSKKARKVTLRISKVKEMSLKTKLHFLISTDVKIPADKSIFEYTYSEHTKKYEGLGLVISRDLSLLMRGELVARNTSIGNIELSLTIPFNTSSEKGENKDYRRRLDPRLAKKKILVVDDNNDSATALEKIFLNFKYSVKVEKRDEYLRNLNDFSMYDIVVIDERLFTTKCIDTLKTSSCKIISLGNFLSSSDMDIDELNTYSLKKPFTQERIYNALSALYIPVVKEAVVIEEVEEESTEKLEVYKSVFPDTAGISLSSFSKFSGKKILLVEDNLINQKVIISILGKSGIDISIANNGQESVDMINFHDEFDLVLMDINMPIMDGYTATKIIRDDLNRKMLPIISLSALTSVNEVSQMFASGMNGYIAKPLHKEKLFTAFSMFINTELNTVEEEVVEEVKELVYEGLDIHKGIEQADGNSMLYKELLGEFRDAYGQSHQVFKDLVEDHRYEQAKMLCLDLQGLAGSICADDMHKLATEMHKQLIYKKYDLLPKYIKAYTIELKILNNSITEYVT